MGGYLASPTVVPEAIKLQSQITSCACSLSQHAGIAALRDVPDEWFSDRLKDLREKRDFVVSRLQSIPGITCVIPQGAFYVLPDITGCLGTGAKVSNGDEFCKVLLQEYQVALVPGGAFEAPAAFRVSYAATMENLVHAMDATVDCVRKVRAPS